MGFLFDEPDYLYDNDERYEEDEARDLEEQRKYEIASNCTCGAWYIQQNKVYHSADCICGAE